MSLTGGIDNLVLKAIEYEAKFKGGVAAIFSTADPEHTGYIDPVTAVTAVCAFMKIPPPTGVDKASTDARLTILKSVELNPLKAPAYSDEDVVKYGFFLRKFKDGLERSPMVNSDKFGLSDQEKLAAQVQPKGKLDLTLEEIHKLMDENLPKYYSSTTDAYLKMKPPHGKFKLAEFGSFMRSIGIDLANDNDKLSDLFAQYDKNRNGHLDPWEFIECFGPSINGHTYSNTSLFVEKKSNKKFSRELKEINLDAKQTKAIIAERLPLHYKSSTKAFLAAKGGVNKRSNSIDYSAFKLWLQNMNIIVPDQTVRDLFRMLDDDGSGEVSCAEFIAEFGHAISGEEATNIQDAEHLSFHNTRPDSRVAVVPRKHMWTYDEVMKCLGERMGLIHTSSTKAFMRAKRCGKTTMDYMDLHRALLNMNIDAPDKVVKRMFKELDRDGDGQVTASEFVAVFGNAINGFAGSFETKPPWFHKEMAALSNVLKNINSEDQHKKPISEDDSDEEGEEENKSVRSAAGSASGAAAKAPHSARSIPQQQQQQQQGGSVAAKEARTLDAPPPSPIKARVTTMRPGSARHRTSSASQQKAEEEEDEVRRALSREDGDDDGSASVGGASARSGRSHASNASHASHASRRSGGVLHRGSTVRPQSAPAVGGSASVDRGGGGGVGGGSVHSRSKATEASAYSGESVRPASVRSAAAEDKRSHHYRRHLDPAATAHAAGRAAATTGPAYPTNNPISNGSLEKASAYDKSFQHRATSGGAGEGVPLNNIRPFFTAKPTNRSKSAEPSRPSRGGRSSRHHHRSNRSSSRHHQRAGGEDFEEDDDVRSVASSASSVKRMSTKNLVQELRKRQVQQRQEEKETEMKRSSRSAPRRSKQAKEGDFDPNWEASAVRLGKDSSQGVAEKFRMKDKLARAKGLAAVLGKQDLARVKSSAKQRHVRVPGGQMESDYWMPSPIQHSGTFKA